MRIQLHIERLILDGLPLDAADTPALRAAIEVELARLLAEGEPPLGLRSGGALAYARGGDLDLGASVSREAGLGARIGRAIHQGINR